MVIIDNIYVVLLWNRVSGVERNIYIVCIGENKWIRKFNVIIKVCVEREVIIVKINVIKEKFR